MAFFLHLLWRHLRQFPGRALAAILVLFAASALMLALASAGAALKFRIGGLLAEIFPEERIELEAGRGRFGPIEMEAQPITNDTVSRVTAQSAVARVYPVEPIRFPIIIQGNLFGTEISSDAIIHGVSRELVQDALAPAQPWGIPADPVKGEYPVVVSNYFLDLYNNGLARASGLPLLSASAVIGRHAILLLGASTVGIGQVAAPQREVRVVAVGISRNPAMLGLALPAEVVRQLNAEFSPKIPQQYVNLVVLLRPGSDCDAFLKAVQPLGLVQARGDVLGSQIKLAVHLGGWGLLGLAAAVFVLGLLTFYMLFALLFHSRRLDLIRLRALGASPAYVVWLVLGEVGLQALIAIALSTIALALLLHWISVALAPLLSRFNSLPPDLLRPNYPLLPLASACILLVTLIPALAMLLEVCRTQPARIIRDI